MIILDGKNLGERQKDLNRKVNDALNKDDYKNLKSLEDKSDADKIFKIDLAAKLKDIDFIIDILKTGDNLYVTRALNKCNWICDDEFSNYINPKYLNDKIFPVISTKMKIKILNKIAMYLKNEKVAVDFYNYCITNKLNSIAEKFLLKTSESYKLSIISDGKDTFFNLHKGDYFKHFIGNSFDLAEACLNACPMTRNRYLNKIKHLYSITDIKYLDLVEKYGDRGQGLKFGKRISTDIMTKHKERVLKRPILYLRILCQNVVTKNSNINDANIYFANLMPETPFHYFMDKTWIQNKFILDIVPEGQKFEFLKRIFNEKYPGAEFDMTKDFYSNKLYNFMTENEREDWALRHIEDGKEILGDGNDFVFYKFVSFDKAFEEIKKIIKITPDKDKRIQLLGVLTQCAKSEEEIQKLLNYFYDRHVNESPSHKKLFINSIIEIHKVFDFNKACWNDLEKILYSHNVFDLSKYIYYESTFRHVVLIYYIINDMKLLDVLNQFIDENDLNLRILKQYTTRLCETKEKKVFDYLLQHYIDKVKTLSEMPYETTKDNIDKIINCTLDLLKKYKRTKQDIPEIINKYIQLDWESHKHHFLFNEEFKPSERISKSDDIKKLLKQDASLVIEKFPEIERYVTYSSNNINWLIRKLKIYFSDDITPKYIQILNECLTKDNTSQGLVNVAVYGLFVLADHAFKVELLEKHKPTNPRIDHATISSKILYVQRAICSHVCFSRPHLPFGLVKQYIKGDYVNSCLPMFNSYLMNLPQPQCIEFIEFLLNNPISIQKHGIRLAYSSFESDNLIKLISNIWRRNKNVSMRSVIYSTLFNKVPQESGKKQTALFELLKKFTLDLNQDDDKEVFRLMSSENYNLPKKLRSEYLEAAWTILDKLPKQVEYFRHVIRDVENDINHVSNEFLDRVTLEHLDKIFENEAFEDLKDIEIEVNEQKWNLSKNHMLFVENDEQLNKKLELVKQFLNKCIDNWDRVVKNKYVTRYYVTDLIETRVSYHDGRKLDKVIVLLESILKIIEEKLPNKDIYKQIWFIQLNIITIKLIIETLKERQESNEKIELEKKIIRLYAQKVGELMTDYIKRGKYYECFDVYIKDCINKHLGDIRQETTRTLYPMEFQVVFLSELLTFEHRKIYFYVAKFLQQNRPTRCVEEYLNAINKLKSYEDEEIQYYLHDRFVNNDLVYRDFML